MGSMLAALDGEFAPLVPLPVQAARGGTYGLGECQ